MFGRAFARPASLAPEGRDLVVEDWSSDGKEPFHLTSDREIASLSPRVVGDSFELGAAQFLLQVPGPTKRDVRNSYVRSPDGRRFIVKTLPEDQDQPVIDGILDRPVRPARRPPGPRSLTAPATSPCVSDPR